MTRKCLKGTAQSTLLMRGRLAYNDDNNLALRFLVSSIVISIKFWFFDSTVFKLIEFFFTYRFKTHMPTN